MSLLLDALKRAEEAKRAKAESAPGEDASASGPAAAPSDLNVASQAANAAATANASELSLEAVEPASAQPTRAPVSAPEAPAEDARGTINAPAATPPLTLEQMIESELGPQTKPLVTSVSSATAAFRAARIGTKKPPTPELELAAASDSASTSPESSPADVEAKRRAINNAFAVKHAQATGSSRPAWLLPVVAVCIAGVGAGGWYVWQEINKISRPASAARAPASPGSAPPTTVASGTVTKAPAVPGAATTTAAPAATVGTTDAPKDQAEAPLPPLLPPQSEAPVTAAAPSASAARKSSQAPTETPREAIARKIEALPEPRAPSRVQLTLAKPAEQKAPSAPTSVGYAALLAGDWAAAKRSYAEAIAANPNDIDAHLGFATALARSGSGRKPEELGLAAKHYRRVLELDPRNAVASAALVAIESEFMPRGGSRAATESELRIIVSQDPTNAAAQFLLGNTYAETRRWTEAQQAYFEAARLAPRNPDYLYNLAVSLDQLGQSRTALDFYRRALSVGAGGQFDRAVVERRIRNLSETATTAEKTEPAAR